MTAENSNRRWLPVPGYERTYDVSNDGFVRSRARSADGKILRPLPIGDGHVQVALYRDGRQRRFQIHRLVLAAFVGPCPDGMEVRHLNGKPHDNRLENLAYGTSAENKQDALRHGVNYWVSKTHCLNGHELTPETLYVYPTSSGGAKRNCRTCALERARQGKARRKLRA